MLPRVRLVLALCGVALVVGCQKSLPTAPSELTAGIVMYEHDDYLGNSAHVVANITSLYNVSGPCVDYSSSQNGGDFNDGVSAIRVFPP
jgi:hypothetical protein